MLFLKTLQVVELLLARGANKEHRNVSDYTPLSLAASGGYVNIIKILLNAGAEINSRQVPFSPLLSRFLQLSPSPEEFLDNLTTMWSKILLFLRDHNQYIVQFVVGFFPLKLETKGFDCAFLNALLTFIFLYVFFKILSCII